NRIQQIVFADHALAVLNEVRQQVKDLRSHRNEFCSAPEFAALGVECIAVKKVVHVCVPLTTGQLSSEPFSTQISGNIGSFGSVPLWLVLRPVWDNGSILDEKLSNSNEDARFQRGLLISLSASSVRYDE